MDKTDILALILMSLTAFAFMFNYMIKVDAIEASYRLQHDTCISGQLTAEQYDSYCIDYQVR